MQNYILKRYLSNEYNTNIPDFLDKLASLLACAQTQTGVPAGTAHTDWKTGINVHPYGHPGGHGSTHSLALAGAGFFF